MTIEENIYTPQCSILQKIVKEELNETPQRITESLNHIKEWLAKQPHIIARLDDKFLLGFIRNSKYKLETAKIRIDTYFTFRTLTPEFFINRDPFDSNIRILLERGIYLPLPEVHPDGGRISITHLQTLQDTGCTVFDLMRVITMTTDRIGLYDDHLTISGVHVIVDLKECTMALATQFLQLAKKLSLIIQNTYPIRIKCIHLYNFNEAPPIFQIFLKTFKGFFKEKIASRFLLHDDLKALHEFVPKKLLPKEYGGDAGTLSEISAKNVIPIMFESKEWFEDDLRYKTDESKRVGQSKDSDMFGIDGSFKKLDID